MKRIATAVFTLLLALAVTPLLAGGANPGHSQAGGKSLGEWMELYWTWALGGDQAGSVKNTVFLPLPAGVPSEEDPSVFEGELDVTLKPGQRFILPVFVFIGERYLEDIPDDQPADYPTELFTGSTVLVTLDGKPLINSEVDDLNEVFFDTEFFDAPILYDEPAERGPGVHAVGALWLKGIGLVVQPLSKGTHTLELFVYVNDFGFGYRNTWNITVGKR